MKGTVSIQNNDIPTSNKYKLFTDAPSKVLLTIAEPNIISRFADIGFITPTINGLRPSRSLCNGDGY